MSSDALSDVLRTVRLTGLFYDVTAGAPWAAEQPPRAMILPWILKGADHLITYHLVTEGRMFAGLVGAEPIAVEAGEVVVFTNGDQHVISSSPGMRAPDAIQRATENAIAGHLPCSLSVGGEGTVTRLACGFLACDARPFNPLIGNLPPVMKVGDPSDSDPSWLGQILRFARKESIARRPGSEGVRIRLSELMFIEVVRRHIESLPAEQTGWLAALRDPLVGKALSLMHGAPARNWTIEELARQAGMSRSGLAERFTALVGMPPMHYLAKWRMQIATEMLGNGAKMGVVAAEVGYGSEAAFSRAFKKIVGAAPSDWRDRDRQRAAIS